MILVNKMFNFGTLFFLLKCYMYQPSQFSTHMHSVQENNLNYWYKRVTKTHTAYKDTIGQIPWSILQILINCRPLLNH